MPRQKLEAAAVELWRRPSMISDKRSLVAKTAGVVLRKSAARCFNISGLISKGAQTALSVEPTGRGVLPYMFSFPTQGARVIVGRGEVTTVDVINSIIIRI